MLFERAKYSESNISMNPIGEQKERRILLADSQLAHLFVALQ